MLSSAQLHGHAPPSEAGELGDEPASTRRPKGIEKVACRYQAYGYCSRGSLCWFSHDPERCRRRKEADTKRKNQERRKTKKIRKSENGVVVYEAVINGDANATNTEATRAGSGEEKQDPLCCICYELPATWALLTGCNHIFCLACIREWRDTTKKRTPGEYNADNPNELLDASKRCPLCRESTRYVIPCLSDPTKGEGINKEYAQQCYLKKCAKIPCKYFEESLKAMIEWDKKYPRKKTVVEPKKKGNTKKESTTGQQNDDPQPDAQATSSRQQRHPRATQPKPTEQEADPEHRSRSKSASPLPQLDIVASAPNLSPQAPTATPAAPARSAAPESEASRLSKKRKYDGPHKRRPLPSCPFANDCHYRHAINGKPYTFSLTDLKRNHRRADAAARSRERGNGRIPFHMQHRRRTNPIPAALFDMAMEDVVEAEELMMLSMGRDPSAINRTRNRIPLSIPETVLNAYYSMAYDDDDDDLDTTDADLEYAGSDDEMVNLVLA